MVSGGRFAPPSFMVDQHPTHTRMDDHAVDATTTLADEVPLAPEAPEGHENGNGRGRRRASPLVSALRGIAPAERHAAVNAARAEIEGEERRQELLVRMSSLSTDELARLCWQRGRCIDCVRLTAVSALWMPPCPTRAKSPIRCWRRDTRGRKRSDDQPAYGDLRLGHARTGQNLHRCGGSKAVGEGGHTDARPDEKRTLIVAPAPG
jgi:hypothetical protein